MCSPLWGGGEPSSLSTYSTVLTELHSYKETARDMMAVKTWTVSHYSPAGIPSDGRRHSGFPGRPIGRRWMVDSAEKLCSLPCHDHVPLLSGCQMPSWYLRAADWRGCPMGYVISHEHPPILGYLEGNRNKHQGLCSLSFLEWLLTRLLRVDLLVKKILHWKLHIKVSYQVSYTLSEV